MTAARSLRTAPGATFEAHAPPSFRERVAALVGNTTWREPGGAGARLAVPMPAAHAVAAALALAKRGRGDIGPDVALCIALGSDAHRNAIVPALAAALKADRHPLTRRNVAFMGLVANGAFDAVVHGRRWECPANMGSDDWRDLLACACRILEALADAALADAEQCWRRRGRS